MARRIARATILCALALASAGGVVACGGDDEEEHHGPFREGLREELGGLEYNVFLTRQLNLALPEDSGFYNGPPAEKGSALFGVFLEVCNRGDEGAFTAASEFKIKDNQGQLFEPRELEPDNPFAYQPRRLGPRDCVPKVGSVAQLGPTGGAMLLFELPLAATENRPLELEIKGPFDREKGAHEELVFELDI